MGPFLHSFSGTWMRINGIHLLLLLGMIFGEAQVDVGQQLAALQLSAEAVINVCFELLGVSGFFENSAKMFRESKLGGHGFGAIFRGQIGCCWISDEMVGRWVFFLVEFTVIPKLKLVELLKNEDVFSILWKNIVETNWKEICHNDFSSQTQCY